MRTASARIAGCNRDATSTRITANAIQYRRSAAVAGNVAQSKMRANSSEPPTSRVAAASDQSATLTLSSTAGGGLGVPEKAVSVRPARQTDHPSDQLPVNARSVAQRSAPPTPNKLKKSNEAM